MKDEKLVAVKDSSSMKEYSVVEITLLYFKELMKTRAINSCKSVFLNFGCILESTGVFFFFFLKNNDAQILLTENLIHLFWGRVHT